MKYIVIICDGASDWPIEEIGNKTIFEVAETPALDFLARRGQMGLLKTIPDGMEPGSECANMSILGYLPEKDLTGRGPLEALSAHVPLNDNDIAFRCNLITIDNNLIRDYSSGHISTPEGRELIIELQDKVNKEGVDFFPGVQYRHILRLDGEKYSDNIKTTPPHDQLDKPYKQFLPRSEDQNDKKATFTVKSVVKLIEQSNSILTSHRVNLARKREGKLMATHIWPWSGGKKPNIQPFSEKYGKTGSVISAVDLIFGIGIAAGLEPIHVEGATGLPDTNYAGKVNAAVEQLQEKDFVYLHIEAIDEMGHTGIPEKKIAALEDFDKKVVKPILDAEEKFDNNLKIAILPDHSTPCKIRTHSSEPVPLVIYNPQILPDMEQDRIFSENSGKEGELGLIPNGEEFMKLFLS